MTPAELVRCPRPVRWRHVSAGQTLVGHDGTDWWVWAVVPTWDGRLHVHLLLPDRRWDGPVDPDEQVQILVPMVERDAVALLAAELGAVQCGPVGKVA